jgi:hypothetical protein
MHLDLNSRIAIDAAQSHAMHLALVHPAQRSTAGLAKAQAPSRRRLILGQVLFSADPQERAGRNLRIGRTGAAERLSTSRAVTASTSVERCIDLVTDATAKTAPC